MIDDDPHLKREVELETEVNALRKKVAVMKDALVSVSRSGALKFHSDTASKVRKALGE